MVESIFPSFFVIGAQKSGTTTLHQWLKNEPKICLPNHKETHFFSKNEHYAKGISWYIEQFPDSSQKEIVGEIDPDYLFFPHVPSRIRTYYKSPKFICILRHPLKRAYSHYLMTVQRCSEQLSFPEALDAEAKRSNPEDSFFMNHHSYLSRGMYYSQINRFQRIFPESRFLYIKFDDLFHPSTCEATYFRICNFIGFQPIKSRFDLTKRYNRASQVRSPFLSRLVHSQNAAKTVASLFIRSEHFKFRIAYLVDSLNKRPYHSIPDRWQGEIPPSIKDVIHSEVTKTAELTNLDLSDWLQEEM
ncbi:MAG: hypothetical protein CL608_07180 [Anaerolineaceae bacterium]|nr:hypothetical protein [Anaerolineaceae bacterium]